MGAGRARRGRPQDPGLTARLREIALDVLAEQGWDRLTHEALAVRAGAGRASIYRRWPTRSALAVDAIAGAELVTWPADNGSLRDDLVALLRPWCRGLSRDELAAAALTSQATRDGDVRCALQQALLTPLATVVGELLERDDQRGQPVTAASKRLLRVLTSLWWNRYHGDTGPVTVADVSTLVDGILLPTAAPRVHRQCRRAPS